MTIIVYFLASFLAVAIVLSLHEFAHAFVAYKCGDPTAKWAGRMTVNPMKHFDLVGLLLFAVAGFGWAKPVPINPNNFKNYRRGYFLTSIAGVLINYLTALLLFYPLMILIERAIPFTGTYTLGDIFMDYFTYLLYHSSLSFCVFNLLPIYPLDGFRMIDAIDKKRGKVYRFLRMYGQYILMGLIILSYFCQKINHPLFEYLDVLGQVMGFLRKIFETPIVFLWGLIL